MIRGMSCLQRSSHGNIDHNNNCNLLSLVSCSKLVYMDDDTGHCIEWKAAETRRFKRNKK